MATTANIISVSRPVDPGYDANGGRGRQALADYLVVRVDRYADGRVIRPVKLNFADHAGLEAEFLAQLETTVLQAAVTTEIGNEDWTSDQLSVAQRGAIGVALTIA